MSDKKGAGKVSGMAMGMFLVCLVAIGAGAIVLDGQRAASGGASARVGMLDTERQNLRAQLYNALATPPPTPAPARLIRVERNTDVSDPLIYKQNADQQVMGSFKIFNDSDDAVILRKATITVPPGSSMSSTRAYLVRAGESQVQLGSTVSVPNQTTPRDVAFSNTTGFELKPHSVAVLDIKAKPAFSKTVSPSFIAFKSAEIFAAPVLGVSGQGVATSAPVPVPGQPTGFRAVPGDRQITLSWDPTPNATRYTLKRGTTPNVIADLIEVGNVTSTVNQGLVNGTTYYYVMMASNTSGSGQASAQVSATPTVALPPPPPAAQVSATVNGAFASPTYAAGDSNVRVGSFTIRVPSTSTEAVGLSSLTFNKDMNANLDMANLYVKIRNAQFGMTTSTVRDTESSMVFSVPGSSAVIIEPGTSIDVDLYADILGSTTPGTNTAVFDLADGAVTGRVSGTLIPFPASANNEIYGQNIIIRAPAEEIVLSLATGPNNAPGRYVVMGATSTALYDLRISSGSLQSKSVSRITFTDSIQGALGGSSFTNYKIYGETGMEIGATVSTEMPNSSSERITFNLTTPIAVSLSAPKTIRLKADAKRFIDGAVSGSEHVFGIKSATDVVAEAGVSIVGTPSGNIQTVYRTKPSLSSSVVGPTTGRSRVAVDDIATLMWSANAADDLTVQNVSMKFAGSAIASGTTAFSVSLIDQSTNIAWGASTQQVCSPGVNNSCSVTFGPEFSITRGSSKAVKLRVDSANFGDMPNASDSLSVTIEATRSITWSDGTTAGIGWEPVLIPITIVNANY